MLHSITIGEGPQIVIIHGLPNDMESMKPLAESLSNEYTVTLVDLPGAGQSPSGPEDMSMEYMANQVQLLIEGLNIDSYILMGHSMGGYTALEIAAKYPNRIIGLSLIHSLATADDEEKKSTRKKSIDLILGSEEGKSAFLKGMVKNLFDEKYAKDHPEALEKVYQKGMELSQHDLANFYHAIMVRSDKNYLLEQVNFPIQWIIGESDKATPSEVALKECHLPKVSDVQIFKNIGHMSMVEAPEQLLRALSQFCKICLS